MNIAKIMVPKAVTVCLNATCTVRQGVEIMRRHGYTAIPVIDEGGMFVGCVHDRDFLRFLLDSGTADMHEHEQHLITEILRKDFCPPLPITAGEEEVIDATLRQNFVPIVDDRGCLCGIVTRRMVIAHLAGREVPTEPDEFADHQM